MWGEEEEEEDKGLSAGGVWPGENLVLQLECLAF